MRCERCGKKGIKNNEHIYECKELLREMKENEKKFEEYAKEEKKEKGRLEKKKGKEVERRKVEKEAEILKKYIENIRWEKKESKGKETKNSRKEAVMETLADTLPRALPDSVDILTVDGLGITMKEGWVLVRPSGTEPVIRITCEARSPEIVQRILNEAKDAVEGAIDSA